MIWQPNSWRDRPILQVPDYPNEDKVVMLRQSWQRCHHWCLLARHSACATSWARWRKARPSCCRVVTAPESFAEFSANNIRDSFRVLLQMAVVLTFGAAMPVVKIGRLAGQFAGRALRQPR